MRTPPQFPLARQSAGVAPPRLPGSIRRTTSIDSTWPDGASAPRLMIGHARDIITPLDGSEPVVIAEASYRLRVSPMREILEIATEPADPRMAGLVGTRAGGESRKRIAATVGDLAGGPLYQILDDFAGASLVALWVWSQWHEDWKAFANAPAQQQSHGRRGNMLDICTGFAEGSSALGEAGMRVESFLDPVRIGSLASPDDPAGWHPLPDLTGPAMRRSRRIDLWRQGNLLMVDAGFQDGGTSPAGGLRGVHEYRVHAEIDPASQTLLAMQALPLILPFPECPGASIKASRMVGHRVDEFRDTVLTTLEGTLGCTHLNDVLRALADVPAMARHL